MWDTVIKKKKITVTKYDKIKYYILKIVLVCGLLGGLKGVLRGP